MAGSTDVSAAFDIATSGVEPVLVTQPQRRPAIIGVTVEGTLVEHRGPAVRAESDDPVLPGRQDG